MLLDNNWLTWSLRGLQHQQCCAEKADNGRTETVTSNEEHWNPEQDEYFSLFGWKENSKKWVKKARSDDIMWYISLAAFPPTSPIGIFFQKWSEASKIPYRRYEVSRQQFFLLSLPPTYLKLIHLKKESWSVIVRHPLAGRYLSRFFCIIRVVAKFTLTHPFIQARLCQYSSVIRKTLTARKF